MAKKDLSHAKGLDALFSNSTTVKRPEPSLPKPQAKKKTTPKVKTPAKKVAKTPKVENPIQEEVVAIEKGEELEVAASRVIEETPQVRTRKPKTTNKEQVFSVNLEGVRKRKIEYTGIRLKKDLFDRLESIANKEKLKSTNSLIAIVLEAYCEGYES